MQAKRLIHEYRFDKATHHVALVHKNQGGAANGYKEALVLKSTNDIQDEDIEKATMNPYFRSYNPRWRVKVSNLTGNPEEQDISDYITSISTNKAYGRATGTWQLMMVYKKITSWRAADKGELLYYHEIIKPDDVVTIEMDAGDGNGMKPVMYGLVDRTSVVRQGDTQIIRQVKISGQDAGKLLANHDIGWDISGATAQLPTGYVKQTDSNKINPSDMIRSVTARIPLQAGTAKSLFLQLKNIFLKQLNNRLTTSMNFTTNTDDDGWMLGDEALAVTKDSSVWDAMMRVSHRPNNMLNPDTSSTK